MTASLRKVTGGVKELEETFKSADEDKSGSCDYNEFKNIYVLVVNIEEEFKKRYIHADFTPGSLTEPEGIHPMLS